jgi:hypothetical protein
MTHTTGTTPLPRYQCHKKVWALKIKAIDTEKLPEWVGVTCRGSSAFQAACNACERCEWEREHGPKLKTLITPEDAGYGPFQVEPSFMEKHQPQVGGYYVIYEDGYVSFSPAAAFEDGYTRI